MAAEGEAKQWQIFQSLDLKEEGEMLELAHFLDSLMSEFSSLSRQDCVDHLDQGEEEEEGGAAASGGAAATTAPSHLGNVSISIGEASSPGNIDDFGPLPKGDLSTATATSIIDALRRGGKLSYKSFKKLLRDVYKRIKTSENLVTVRMDNPDVQVHVVGDLHGQLEDLLHIIDDAGMPSPTNKYVFNGDFVDRGHHSVEIIGILFGMFLAWPNCVFLNRGNHEDHVICCQPPPPHGCGGFQRECKAKYDDLVFSMVVEVFRYLPIVHLIEDKVLIIHGGLFHRPGVTLQDIRDINRLDYCPVPGPEAPPTSAEEERGADLRQVMRDALWSDPRDVPGCEFNNARKQGQLFGPDVTTEFLQTNNLCMVVRSHECVKAGFETPYASHAHILCTIFSASGYGGSNNDGAYLTFSRAEEAGSRPVLDLAGQPTGMFFTVSSYTVREAHHSVEDSNRTSLRALVLRKKQELLDAFRALDTAETGSIPLGQWTSTMASVTGVVINWNELLPLLDLTPDEHNNIDYHVFMGSLKAGVHKLDDVGSAETDMLFNAMYANRAILEVLFNFFDTNGDGVISKEEFRHGCEILNSRLPAGQQINAPDHLLEIMDIDQSDGIDINEFFEVFRLVDAADGSLDGNIDLAGGQAAS